MRIGYACQNITVREQGYKRLKMLHRQFLERGLAEVGAISFRNLNTLMVILGWNHEHGIHIYRTTDIFPWWDKYPLESLPNWEQLQETLLHVGWFADQLDQRITIHPSSFCVLASPNWSHVMTSITELNLSSRLFSEMGYNPSYTNKVNVHIGGSYGDKSSTMARFCRHFELLEDHTRSRLTIENDDRISGYTVEDLYEYVHKNTRIPIVFDYHHHRLNPGRLTEREALHMAHSTWPSGIIPVVHYSSSKRDHEDPTAQPVAHSDHIHENVNLHGLEVDVVFEAKQTEKAVLQARANGFI